MSPLRRLSLAHARDQRGFGMIELVAAMSILVIGLLAVFTMFQSGIIAIQRAGYQTTAAVLADSQMEQFRAIKYESIGLSNTAVDAADAVYKADVAYSAGGTATATLSSSMTASATTMSVSTATGFPTSNGFRVKVNYEIVRVVAGAGTTSWTVKRSVDGTVATTQPSASNVSLVQRVDVNSCGSAPCTSLVPTTNVTGPDGRKYRIDIYATWAEVMNTSGASGRAVKLMTVVVRDQASPYKVWARVASTFDISTGS